MASNKSAGFAALIMSLALEKAQATPRSLGPVMKEEKSTGNVAMISRNLNYSERALQVADLRM
ncbi:hypothetical protein BTUL_0007g00740 [Botrytis tulipae]|uniref:Uncharacterized protein n=1 Tax=Botrytis tulipae TaxID=87230 RepID=A0A4Z1F3E7_9HELO|nr:hypothetical protein BTUL_0007g00740 [Botrytis tulipae]